MALNPDNLNTLVLKKIKNTGTAHRVYKKFNF